MKTKAPEIYPVFVYGTLRKGCRFNKLLDKAVFYDNATLEKYKMYYVPGNYPAITNTGDDNDEIAGDVFFCTLKTLMELDNLETPAGYVKKVLSVKTSACNRVYEETLDATVYVQNKERLFFREGALGEIKSGDWLVYKLGNR